MENDYGLDKYKKEREKALAEAKETAEEKVEGKAHFAVNLSAKKFKEIYETAVRKIGELEMPPHNERFSIIQLEQLLGMKNGRQSTNVNKVNYDSVYCVSKEVERILEDTINELFEAKVLSKKDYTLVKKGLMLTIRNNEELEAERLSKW